MNKELIELQAQTNEQHFGKRLDQVIADLFPEYSRSRLKDWILAEKVLVNGKIITKAREKMQGNEDIVIYAELEVEVHHEAENIELDIIYEDDDVLVVNKPSGLVVHPAPGHYQDTLVNGLMYHIKSLSDINGDARPGIVHRIDKDTSGLLMVAKNNYSHLKLSEELKDHKTKREYIALVNFEAEPSFMDCLLSSLLFNLLSFQYLYQNHIILDLVFYR